MSNYNLYYRNQCTKEIIVKEVATGTVMETAKSILCSLICDRRFGVYLVREEEIFTVFFNGSMLSTLHIREQALPEQLRMYLLLLGA